jgi:8-oxo-dGTP pyrophosphatase MutT (NUDIX family)
MTNKTKTPVTTCGIFLYDTVQKKILACHASKSSWKTWSIPKGLKEDGEDCYTAAARELREETGISLEELNIRKTYSLETVKYQKQNKFLESFLVITDTDLSKFHFECSTFVHDKYPEIDKWKWIEPITIKEVLHESQQKHYERIIELIHN